MMGQVPCGWCVAAHNNAVAAKWGHPTNLFTCSSSLPHQITYQAALAAAFVEGWIFVLISVSGVRGLIMELIPHRWGGGPLLYGWMMRPGAYFVTEKDRCTTEAGLLSSGHTSYANGLPLWGVPPLPSLLPPPPAPHSTLP